MRNSLLPDYETKLLHSGFDAIIGIDEAGRGPWAGPVSIAAYIFTRKSKIFDGVNDSKKLTRANRANVYANISRHSDSFFHELVPSQEIDNLGIGIVIENSIQSLMDKVNDLYRGPYFLIDGYFKTKFKAKYELIKAGDSKIYSIATASIIAKQVRDNIMYDFAKEFPSYGFDSHVGYGTRKHLEALQKYGPCPIHRYSYKPIAGLVRSSL